LQISALHVPDISRRLFSVVKAINNGHEIHFEKNPHLVINCGAVSVDIAMQPDGPSYCLTLTNSSLVRHTNNEELHLGSAINIPNDELWHLRLGHIPQDKISKMAKDDVVDGLTLRRGTTPSNNVCEPCILSKSHREQQPTN